MFDRFTEDAKRTMNLARQASQRLGHDYLGTEHILFGLLEIDDPLTRKIFTSLQVDSAIIRKELDLLVLIGVVGVAPTQIPFTPRAKKVLELAMEVAGRLRDRHLGVEHLLLGLLLEREGVGAQALVRAGLTSERVFEKVVEMTGREDAGPPASPASTRGLGTNEALAVLRIAQGLLVKQGEADAARAVGDVIARIERSSR
ncbi:MAG TPA: Clp protease N-terminal domain-containing protein [Planctomycetota bacterium]|jgi:ATP-dependent Clp protease ATP-binding subunit ClpC|nr:Clp protease N-terminal domain-containing protein [Planctomycetota bacterium]